MPSLYKLLIIQATAVTALYAGSLTALSVDSVSSISNNGQVIAGTSNGTGYYFLTESAQLFSIGQAITAVSAKSTTTDFILAGRLNDDPILFTGSGSTALPTTNAGQYGGVTALSGDGRTSVGFLQSPNGTTRAAYWQNGTVFDLGGTNTIITGTSGDGTLLTGHTNSKTGPTSGFLYDTISATKTSTNTILPGATKSIVTGISSDGNTLLSQTVTDSFIYNRRSGVTTKVANALLNTYVADGTIAGGTSGTTAVLWDNTHGVRTVQAILTALSIDTTGWSAFESITTVVTDGLNYFIGGTGTKDGKKTAYIVAANRQEIDPNVKITSIPETSHVTFMAASLITIVALRVRRKLTSTLVKGPS